jgi:hypothetical protein
LTLPQPFFDLPDIAGAVSGILEGAANHHRFLSTDDKFWRLFDRTALAIEVDQTNVKSPDRDDWVNLAINSAIGKLAAAFFSALFARDLKVGSKLPADLVDRLNELVNRTKRTHRLARTIAASRLSYLHAVDPEWTQVSLLPSFDWSVDEEEALAVWQGYAWQPRVDRKLWDAIKAYFIPMFTRARLNRLGDMGRNLAQMLVLVGVEFGLDEIPRDQARNAIRAMPQDMRTEVVVWLVSFFGQSVDDDSTDGEQPPAPADRDRLWSDRVRPWIERVWPPDPDCRSSATAEQFALLATATVRKFPEAVALIEPHLVPANAHFVLHRLAATDHPEKHPNATLSLVDAIVDPEAHRLTSHLPQILQRVVTTAPALRQDAKYRRWNDRIRARGG